jgi:hypothetical protein
MRPIGEGHGVIRGGTARARASWLQRRRAVAATSLAALWAAALLGLGACGYHQDVPTLPGGANALHLQRIANLTGVGELDVRLRAELEARFSRQAHLRLAPSERSALSLQVALIELTTDRLLDPAITSDRTFLYTLRGAMTLTDQRSGRKLIDNDPIAVQVSRIYGPAVRDTPAIRNEGVNDVLAQFAEEVEQRLFRSF